MIIVSILMSVATCATLKFRLAYKYMDLNRMNVVYEECKNTGLAPHVYMKHDKLPSFREYIMSFCPKDADVDEDEDSFAEYHRVSVDSANDAVDKIGQGLESLRQEAISSFLDQTTPSKKESDSFYSKTCRFVEEYTIIRGLQVILISFVTPICNFWLIGNDMDRDDALFHAHYFPIVLLDIGKRLDFYIGPEACTRNPCGLGEEYMISFKSFSTPDESDYENMREILDKVLCLDLATKMDENILNLYEIEKVYAKRRFYHETVELSFLRNPDPSNAFLLKKLMLPNMDSCDIDFHAHLSARQLYCDMKSLIQGPIEYRPKTNLVFNTQVTRPFILQVLPQEVIDIIVSFVLEQPLNYLRLVCKAFYLAFNDMPCESRNWPPVVPLSSRKSFFTASVMTELQKEQPDYEAFAERLVELPFTGWRAVIVGSTTCPDQYLDLPDILTKWERMMKMIETARKSNNQKSQ